MSMMTLELPDGATLSAIGAVTVRHTQLDRILRMTIKTLTGVSIQEAVDATVRDGSANLRQRVRKIARRQLGECPELVKLQALLTRCAAVTDRRNELVHRVIGKELDGDVAILNERHEWEPMPPPGELMQLADDIMGLISELNSARLEGYLFEVLESRKAKPRTGVVEA